MRKLFVVMVKGLLYLGLPLFVFYVVYHKTDDYFRLKKIPYPFEIFGIVIALGLASWTLAVVEGLRAIARKLTTQDHRRVIS